MTLSEYLTLWIDTYIKPNKAENTTRAYQDALNHLSQEARDTDLSALSPLLLQREINMLAAAYSRQAQIMYTALRAALRRAELLRMIGSNPMYLVEKPTHEKREIEFLSPAEAAAYADAAMNQPAGKLLILMLCLGLRRNEARGLRFGDMDRYGILHLQQQRTRNGLKPLKSKSSRRALPVPEALLSWFDGPQGEYLCDVSEKALRTQHRRVLEAIGVDRNVTLHGLRHTAATTAIADGAELVTVQKMLGHKHLTLTADLYVHNSVEILRPCVNVLFGSFLHHNIGEGARLEIV